VLIRYSKSVIATQPGLLGLLFRWVAELTRTLEDFCRDEFCSTWAWGASLSSVAWDGLIVLRNEYDENFLRILICRRRLNLLANRIQL